MWTSQLATNSNDGEINMVGHLQCFPEALTTGVCIKSQTPGKSTVDFDESKYLYIGPQSNFIWDMCQWPIDVI